MGKDSSIEWTHSTFNPWIGCAKVSPGCEFCYAAVDSPARISRSQGLELWGPNAGRKFKADSGWAEPLKWDRAAAKVGARHRVFCASQADVFEDRPDLIEPRSRLYRLIHHTPNLDWLLLTKRPENILRLTYAAWCQLVPGHVSQNEGDGRVWKWPANVWIGTSVENQKYADLRIPLLLKVPARVRFLSIEPLLGPVDLTRVRENLRGESFRVGSVLQGDDGFGLNAQRNRIDWVIVGGESGSHARPMNPTWIRALRDQCVAAEVPFFFKQWGEWLPYSQLPESWSRSREEIHGWGNDGVSYRVGKKAAGRLLDGREWNEIPTPTAKAVTP